MAFSNPAVADFKARFVRDFSYQDPMLATDLSKVQDSDIAQAFQNVNMALNASFFGDQGGYTNGYLTLSAFYLVQTLQSSGGLSGGGFSFPEQSKSVGSISASYGIPQKILENPIFAMLAGNKYGMQYLMMILPYLTGQVFAVQGMTKP